MIPLIFTAIVGFLFGWGLIGPIAVTYSARAYFPLIFFVVFVMGLAIFMALVLGGALQGSAVVPLSGLLLGLAWWAVYAFTIAFGTSLRVRLRKGTWK